MTADCLPVLLASADGAVVGLVGPEGRAMSAPRGAGFAAGSWLENDGDLADQEAAAARPGFDGPPGARSFVLGGLTGIHLKGRGAVAQAEAACATHDIVILSLAAPDLTGPCLMIDARLLTSTGTLAIEDVGGALRLTPTEGAIRLWSPRRDGPDDLPRLLALGAQ
jgi:competence protein ComEC